MSTLSKFIPLLLVTLLSGCLSMSSDTNNSSSNYKLDLNTDKSNIYSVEFKKWVGTPYQYGGTSLNGVDCSAFVQSIIQIAQQKVLPRTTIMQSKEGSRISLELAQRGDLIFFKTTTKDKHVGIYIGNNQFMHASTSKGVIISRLDNPYWSSVFWQIRRLD